MRLSLRLLALFFTSALLLRADSNDAASVPTMKAGDWDVYSDTWGATDGLGRTLPDNSQVGDPKPDKTIAMFCFMANNVSGVAVADHTKMLAADPNLTIFPPPNSTQWWGQPWLGYYLSSDHAVIRKHLQMLADAGVDVMVMDNTNGVTYPDVRQAMCEVMTEMRANGLKTPQIAFFSGNGSWKELQQNFYGKNLYPDLWFKWQGKPLLLVNNENIDPAVAANFTIRQSWAWTNPGSWFQDGHDKWPWLDNSPQNFGWHDAPNKPEEISVAVAQHATTSIGRSYSKGKEPPLDAFHSADGIYFDEQWKRALEVNPEVVFVTGWDEWTAGNFTATAAGTFADRPTKAGDSSFVDEYSEEFSRDIEPENGVLQDNYYYQFVTNARRYKGVRPVPPIKPHPIRMNGRFEDWKAVQPEFRDEIGDTVHRDSPGWGTNHYVNQTGRNDLVSAKVSYDSSNIYFYVRTKDAITPHTDPNWMLLYIDYDNDPTTGWLGYDFVINRADVEGGTTTVQKNVGNEYKWQTIGRVTYRVDGNEMEIAVPFRLFGGRDLPSRINFKWADNIQQTGDPSDFTLNGDAAPNDRFYYVAKLKPSP
jgi:hypothetical protein